MTDVDASPVERLAHVRSSALAELDRAADATALEQWRITHLGRRSELSTVLSGLGKLTTKQVAARAGASEASVYYHFKDKVGLVQAAVQ